MPVKRAKRGYNRQAELPYCALDMLFFQIKKRTDNGKIRALQIAFGSQGIKAAFIKHAEQKGFQSIIAMMG